MTRKIVIGVVAAALALALLAWGGSRLMKAVSPAAASASRLPVTQVKRGDVTITVSAKGELSGGHTEMLAAPMTGGGDMAITFLREPGETVAAGDVVVKFDTTEQEFKLKEAEADLAEAEQQVIQTQADNQAKEEETRYALLQAKMDVRTAELEARRNPILADIVARENTLALEAAKDHLRQLEHDAANRQATSAAAVAIQEAARNKAKVKAETARQNIENMVLKAKAGGYVSVMQNTNGNFMYYGMQLPALQVGDTVNAGMTVAQIPDLHNWEVTASIGELDRGHLSVGQKVQVAIVALPGKAFNGTVKDIGGTVGAFWNRHFDCKIALEQVAPGMRPGMSSNIVISTGTLPNSLWVPSQALFESDGRTFVYLETPSGFTPRDVKLVRRSESQVVLTGVREGQVVAMANPSEEGQNAQSNAQGKGSAMKALSR
ncbi:MAG TPA: HlyD family efflux transporter periplasmic adaptor subunit [Bryobacteraceae bacterium]|nr:HlyD family efflux transporter periplasmic adaptor subunit [Bryobacteraceae bacterium]